MEYILGSRGSALALAQTQWVQKKLQTAFPNDEFPIKIIATKGDLVLDRPLEQVGGKGIFVREIEQQILERKVHIGVHSLKDMPTCPPKGLCYTQFWKRQNSFDALVLNHPPQKTGIDLLAMLPMGATIGTGSKRRVAQLKFYRPDLNIVPIRGNIQTRLEKMKTQQLDGLILAAAGLHRLGLEDKIVGYFPSDLLTPAPGQGTLALEVLQQDTNLQNMLNSLADPQTHLCASAERAFLQAVDGGCHLPVGAYCMQTGNHIKMIVFLGNESQTFAAWKKGSAAIEDATALANQLAEQLLRQRGEYR